MSELEIKSTGVTCIDGKEIPVYSIGSPNPVDYTSFDILKGVTILSSYGNRLSILKDGNKETYYIGESNDALFLSESNINTGITGYDILEKKMIENPLSGLEGFTIEKVFKYYLSAIDESKDLPYSVIFKTRDEAGYNLTGDDCEILVYKSTFNSLMYKKLSARINSN